MSSICRLFRLREVPAEQAGEERLVDEKAVVAEPFVSSLHAYGGGCKLNVVRRTGH